MPDTPLDSLHDLRRRLVEDRRRYVGEALEAGSATFLVDRVKELKAIQEQVEAIDRAIKDEEALATPAPTPA